MKKFYLALSVSIFFLFITLFAKAQTCGGGTYATVSAGGLMSAFGTWVGNHQPPPHCSNCCITINGPVIMDNTTVNPILDDNSVLIISATSSLEVDTYAQVFSSTVIIGNDATHNATLTINDEVDLVNSTVRLANNNVILDASNSGGNPPSGPLGTDPNFDAGLFYITDSAAFYTGGHPLTSYDYVISPIGYGAAVNAGPCNGTTFICQYSINCGSPTPPCFIGGVWGPAINAFDPTLNSWDFQVTSVLPVVLVQFIASKNSDGTNELLWTTSQEENSSYFDVQRSADGGNWQSIGTVAAKGNSSVASNYTFVDAHPMSSINYYRLKMVDLDGKFAYSKVVSVNTGASTESLVIYNNPFTDMIRLKLNTGMTENVTFTVTDMLGKVYLRQSSNIQTGDNLINLNPQVAAGFYILHIQGNTYDKTVKLVKE